MDLLTQVSDRLRLSAAKEEPSVLPLNTDNAATAKRVATREGYTDIGGGSFRGQHGSVWALSRDAQGKYQLCRTSAEADLFDAAGGRTASRQTRTAQIEPKPDDMPEAKADAAEREGLGLTISPVSAYMKRAARNFVLTGAHFCDEIPEMASRIAAHKGLRTDLPLPRPVARMANLEGMVGAAKLAFARHHILAGSHARHLSKAANVPLLVAYRAYPVVASLRMEDQIHVLKAAKGDQKYTRYAETHYPRQLDRVSSLIARYKVNRLAFGPLNADDESMRDCAFCAGSSCVPKAGGKCSTCGEVNGKFTAQYDVGVDVMNDGGKDDFWESMNNQQTPDLSPKDCPSCKGSNTLQPNSIGDEYDCSGCGQHFWTDVDAPGALYDEEGNTVGRFAVKTAFARKAEVADLKARWDRMSAKEQASLAVNPASPYFNPRALTNKAFNRLWAHLVRQAQAMLPPPEEAPAQPVEASPYEYGVDTYNDGLEEGGFWDQYLNPGHPEPDNEEGEEEPDGDEPMAMQASLLSRIPRIAVDDAAKRYWETYFGDYGSTWVSDVKRRLKADLIAATLKATGVDDAAAKYYGEYFGDYGKDLVDEKARSLKDAQMAPPAPPSPAPAQAPAGPPAPGPVAPPPAQAQPAPPAEPSDGELMLEEKVGSKRVALFQNGGSYTVVSPGGKTRQASVDAAMADFREAVMKL